MRDDDETSSFLAYWYREKKTEIFKTKEKAHGQHITIRVVVGVMSLLGNIFTRARLQMA